MREANFTSLPARYLRGWLVLGLLLPLAAGAQTMGGAEAVRPAEAQPPFPEFPRPENYLAFPVTSITPFAFFIDAKSISLDGDGVVRYSLIARSSEGAANVTYEGLRCSTGEYRIFAFGRTDKSWSEARSSQWQSLPRDTRNAQRTVLFNDYLCSKSRSVVTADDVVQALRAGPTAHGGGGGY